MFLPTFVRFRHPARLKATFFASFLLLPILRRKISAHEKERAKKKKKKKKSFKWKAIKLFSDGRRGERKKDWPGSRSSDREGREEEKASQLGSGSSFYVHQIGVPPLPFL